VGRCPRTLPLSRESDSGRQLGGRLVLPRLASGDVARMLLGEPKSPVILRNPRQSAAQNRLREVAGSKPAAPIRKKACYRAAFLRWGGPATRVDDGLNIAILPMCAQNLSRDGRPGLPRASRSRAALPTGVPPYVMRQVGRSDPKVTLGIYAQVMLRKGGERERLRALVRGDSALPSLGQFERACDR
jgi:hypothetical protein